MATAIALPGLPIFKAVSVPRDHAPPPASGLEARSARKTLVRTMGFLLTGRHGIDLDRAARRGECPVVRTFSEFALIEEGRAPAFGLYPVIAA